MAVKHALIKPLQHAGVASQDTIFISGGVIIEGAPVVFSSGKVVAGTDAAAGVIVTNAATESGALVGFALNACSAANADCHVALALPGRIFVGSLGTNASNSSSDDGLTALALANIGDHFEMHLDATTALWMLGAVAGSGTAGALVIGLVDKVGATTGDAQTFGSSGPGAGAITPSTATPPGRTFEHNPPGGPNSGMAKVKFMVPYNSTIFGVGTVA